MIKSVFVLMIIGAALVPFTSGKKHEQDQRLLANQRVVHSLTANRAAMTPASLKAILFTLSSPTGKTCKLEKFSGKIRSSYLVAADKECDDIHAGLSQAVSWIDGTQGTARIMGKDGKVLLYIGPSDGFAYESINSGSEIITLE